MRRFFLPTIAATMLLSLTLIADASAMRVTGSTLDRPAQVRETVSLGNYIAAAGAAYARLSDCACSCGTFDVPTHRCAACRTTAASMRQMVARIRRVQAELARLDVPPAATQVQGELVEAAAVLQSSGNYMVSRISRDPRSLLVSTRSMEGTRKVSPPAWLTSPHVVRDARLAEYMRLHPAPTNRTERMRVTEIATGPDPAIQGAPGEQAQAYLAKWRDGVERLVRQEGLSFAATIVS
jgi:hypothetical protein